MGRELDVFGEQEWSQKSDEDKQKVLTPRPNEMVRAANGMEDPFKKDDSAETSADGEQSAAADESATDAEPQAAKEEPKAEGAAE